MKIVYLVCILTLSGCTTYQVGMTYQNNIDEVENPLGIIRGEKIWSEHFSGACEHISSIPQVDDFITLDHCGVYYTF